MTELAAVMALMNIVAICMLLSSLSFLPNLGCT